MNRLNEFRTSVSMSFFFQDKFVVRAYETIFDNVIWPVNIASFFLVLQLIDI